MAHEQIIIVISASLQRNNTYKDEVHNELWKEFLERIEMITKIPKYREIKIHIGEK